MRDYPKIYNASHGAVKDIFQWTVHIEEKIDGSQFSFGLKDGRLWMKTHHKDVTNEEPFGQFMETMKFLRGSAVLELVREGYTYRGEVISKLKHNHLTYQRLPKLGNIVIFDIDKGDEDYLGYVDKVQEANRLGLETVPYMFYGTVSNSGTVRSFLDRTPLLGGKIIEGIVVKAYGHYAEDKKTIMAKIVSDAYREIAKDEGNIGAKPTRSDVVQALIEKYRTEPRWRKAVQTLRDNNTLKNDPSDIQGLRVQAMKDIEEECGDEIKNALYMSFKNDVLRGSVGGLPEWWKKTLQDDALGAVVSKETVNGPSDVPPVLLAPDA